MSNGNVVNDPKFWSNKTWEKTDRIGSSGSNWYFYPQPVRDVCPGCGRCRVCGQPSPQPQITWGNTYSVP